jgi:hypothetical protein
MKKVLLFPAVVALAAAVASAATETRNALHPYDNTFDDAFWNTTRYPVRGVETSSTVLGSFDSKACDVKYAALERLNTNPPAFILIVR